MERVLERTICGFWATRSTRNAM